MTSPLRIQLQLARLLALLQLHHLFPQVEIHSRYRIHGKENMPSIVIRLLANILQHNQVHVALAVALPEGLVTPVIRNTDHLGVREIARQSRDLATRAKDGKLSNNDYAGGTFTISNLGMFGIEEFTAIINPPQAAILAIGAATPTPWVDASGNLVVQTRVKMTMSCDHRVVDGSTGAAFLKTLVSYLEDPLSMMA